MQQQLIFKWALALTAAVFLGNSAATAADKTEKHDKADKAPAVEQKCEEDAAKAADIEREYKEGFVSLFDGKTLKGWQGDVKGYAVEDGLLVCKKNGGGRISSDKQYADFVLRFEFKLFPGGNNGVALRAPLEGDAAYTGMECQILDDSAPVYKTLKPYQYHGSIYGIFPARRGSLKPAGQWNCEEIVCDGTKIKVTLNGTAIVDGDLATVADETIDGKPHPGRFNKAGHIGFLGHGHRVEFRNLRIKELNKGASDADKHEKQN